MENTDDSKKVLTIIILIIIIIILLYLLFLKFGNIEHHGPQVPTGNVDIFEIDCGCEKCKDIPVFNDDTKKSNYNNDTNDTKENNSSNDSILVFDDYKIWDNKELRIFSNPAYEYDSIIAPGSFNSYAFVIKNNNNFDISINISFKEENEKGINMKYKVRNKDNYLIGGKDSYTYINGKSISSVIIPAKGQISYILDWKWIDNENDTEIGFDIDSTIKLSIDVEASGL